LTGSAELFGGPVAWTDCALEHVKAPWPPLAKHLVYHLQTYKQLEKAYQGSGEEDVSQEVYLDRQNHERKLMWSNGSHFQWFLSCLSWLAIDYGVSPFRLFAATGVVLLIGTIIFSIPGALKAKPGARVSARWSAWHALAVSVEEFVPSKLLPDSFVARVAWKPSDTLWVKRVRIHPALVGSILGVCGWILMPLILLVMGFLVAGLLPGKV
jgi:hypothetical protein